MTRLFSLSPPAGQQQHEHKENTACPRCGCQDVRDLLRSPCNKRKEQPCKIDTDEKEKTLKDWDQCEKKEHPSPSPSRPFPSPPPRKLASNQPEPVLAPTEDRFVVCPIKCTTLFELCKQHVASFWTAEEIDLRSDKKDFDKLNSNEKHFILSILAFFAASDGIVTENLVTNFAREVQIPEARSFYTFQAAMESVHGETHALLINTYLADNEKKKQQLSRATQTIPTVARKAEWALRWCDANQHTFATRLIAFAVVEGTFFSSSFCAIFWLKQRGILPGLAFSNELISRDEGLHCKFAHELQKLLLRPAAPFTAINIVKEAVEIECEFVMSALPVQLIGMNSHSMCEHVKFCADRLLLDMGYMKTYHAKNPFPFMETISLTGKTNFFEKKVGEYAKSGVGGGPKNQFDMEADF